MKALLVGVVLAGVCQAGEVYRWQDAQGQWHFGDAAQGAVVKNATPVSVAGSDATGTNFIKTRVVSPRAPKAEKPSRKSSARRKPASSLTMREKKEQCDRIRDELRLQPFRYAERDRYDHECVTGIKW